MRSGSCQHLLNFLQSRDCYQDLLETNQANRVDTCSVAYINVRNVARSQIQILLDVFGNQQGIIQLQLTELGNELLGFGCFKLEVSTTTRRS